ncbi:lipopolysaccharide biosynthesis protein [Fibrobacter sp. UWEL]|uniref:lipopolysaccharide biosynthesis protein n=1 Tax=Fibrobacter sp. UWEL TaxID=1896209 RepID=UPI000924075A|nr:lipopolysaccharide biosynthesis protein [Fibrobacter sp. UWEL]SHK91725.1 Membrane protein involved in the export of O-antigen and teichoic acid [Fibrobacter sp. UWEL]
MERAGVQVMQFVVTIVLARLLVPEQFGLIALVAIVISIADVFVQSGLGIALIRKKEVDDLDYSSVFFASLTIAAAVYSIIFVSAPFISDFFNQDGLTPVIRVLTLTLFIGVFSSIQNAYVARHMMFRKLFFRGLCATIPSGALGILLAYQGFGVWALVTQQLSNAAFSVLAMWITVPWRPHLQFSWERLKTLFSFGWKLLVSSLIDNIYDKIRALVIGKMFSSAALAFNDRGDQFPKLLITNINNSISAVLLPSLSAYQDDKPQLKRLARRSIVTSSFVIIPMMTGLAVLAKPFVLILLGEKWLPCVPFIQAYCFTYALYPIHSANLSAINAMGRSDIFLKLEIIKKIYGFALLVGSYLYFKTPIGLAYGAMVSAVISTFVNASPNKKLMGYSYFEQVKDICPSFILAAVMALGMYGFSLIEMNLHVSFVLQIILGIIVYLGLAKILHLECFEYIIKTIFELRKKHGR